MKAFTRTVAALIGAAGLSIVVAPAAGAAQVGAAVPAYHHGHHHHGDYYGDGYGYGDTWYDDCGCGPYVGYSNGYWYDRRGDALGEDPYRHHNSD